MRHLLQLPKIVGPAGGIILLFAAAVSCFGNVSGDVLATPRLLFAGVNDGLFPKFLSKVHPKFATPYLAIGNNFLCFINFYFFNIRRIYAAGNSCQCRHPDYLPGCYFSHY
jgi:amino acid transporter